MKDLGDGYYRRYDMYAAWAFWNQAKKVNREHPILQDIIKLEKRLETDFPEYF